jgi:hypothetical protein
MIRDFGSEEDESLKNGFCSIPDAVTMTTWVILSFVKREWAPMTIYLYLLVVAILINMAYRNKLPDRFFGKETA